MRTCSWATSARAKFGLDWDETFAQAEKHMKQVGLKERAATLIKDIGTGKQQLVEIAKALSKKRQAADSG